MIQVLPANPYTTSVIFATKTSKEEILELQKSSGVTIDDDEVERIIESTEDPRYDGTTFLLNSGSCLVYIKDECYKNVEVVSHELYHATNALLHHYGVEHTVNDEPFAYFHGWLVGRYFNFVNKETEQKKAVKKYLKGKDENLADWCDRIARTIQGESVGVRKEVIALLSKESYLNGHNDCFDVFSKDNEHDTGTSKENRPSDKAD